jgi:hypothetical protein
MAFVEGWYANWPAYYQAIWPGFISTCIGVVFSVLFAGALWIWQQRGEDRAKGDKLIENIEFELKKDKKVLKEGEFLFEKNGYNSGRVNDYMLFVGKCLHMSPLRKIAIENYLKNENALLLNETDLEQSLAELLDNIDTYNEGRHAIITVESRNSGENIYGSQSSETRINSVNTVNTIMAVNYRRVEGSLEAVKGELGQIKNKTKKEKRKTK